MHFHQLLCFQFNVQLIVKLFNLAHNELLHLLITSVRWGV